MREYKIRVSDCRRNLPQKAFVTCKAKRIIVRAGRRGGKTEGVSIRIVNRFLAGRRELYAAPTQDQVEACWHYLNAALVEPIDAGVFVRNETRHTIELPNTKQRIRCKTAWNADTLRGDYADDLYLDEFQLMNEDAWGLVGAPMLLDCDGDAAFIYTPRSLHSHSVSKARDPQHAAKLYRKHEHDGNGRWAIFHWTSRQNGYISKEALDDIAGDMSALAYRMEIEAEDIDEAPGALWRRDDIEKYRVAEVKQDLQRIVIGVDPSATSTGDEAGIVACGRMQDHYFVGGDYSLQGSPLAWAREAIRAYHENDADSIIAEANNGGEMVEVTIHAVDPLVPVKLVHASRGKQTRADPISVLYQQGRVHHIGSFPHLEDEMALWVPGDRSPNRMDAMVWGITELSQGFVRKRGDMGIS
jgi:hypothetical protein